MTRTPILFNHIVACGEPKHESSHKSKKTFWGVPKKVMIVLDNTIANKRQPKKKKRTLPDYKMWIDKFEKQYL